MKILIQDKDMGDGTAWTWKVKETPDTHGLDGLEGLAASMPEAMRDAGNAILKRWGNPDLEMLRLVERYSDE